MDQELSRFKRRVLAIEDLIRGVHSKDSRWTETAIEKLSSIQKVSRWIEVAIENARKAAEGSQ